MTQNRIKSTHTGIVAPVDGRQTSNTFGSYSVLATLNETPSASMADKLPVAKPVPAAMRKNPSTVKVNKSEAGPRSNVVNVQPNVENARDVRNATTTLPAAMRKNTSTVKVNNSEAGPRSNAVNVQPNVENARDMRNATTTLPAAMRKNTSTIKVNNSEAGPQSPMSDDQGYTKVVNKRNVKKASANSNVMTITVNGKKCKVCSTWAALCVAPLDEKKNFKCTHPRNDANFPHLRTPICFRFCTGVCPEGDSCKNLHPVELAHKEEELCQLAEVPTVVASAKTKYAAPTTSVGQSKVRTAICAKFAMNRYNPSHPGCDRGSRCAFAHTIGGVNLYGFIKDFQEDLFAGKIDLQEIFNEVYSKIHNKIGAINIALRESNKPTVSDLEPIPSNFADILRTWTMGASAMRRMNSERTQGIIESMESDESSGAHALSKMNQADTLGLFDGPDSKMENRVWALSRVCYLCPQDRDCEYKKLVAETCGIASGITANDICLHDITCKRGAHTSCIKNGVVPVFCMDEICGNCKCESLEEINAKRAGLISQLAKLKAERIKLKADGVPTKTINSTIESVSWTLINTFRKLHFSEFGCKAISEVNLETEQPVFDMTQIQNMSAFTAALPSMTAEQLAVYQADTDAFNARIAAMRAAQKEAADKIAAEKKAARDIWYNNLVSTIDFTNPMEASYINSGAFDYMTLQEYTIDCTTRDDAGQCYNTWCKTSKSISFPRFKKDVATKKSEWETMGIDRRIIKSDDEDHEDEVDEFCVPSDKDNYRNFWAWYFKIPVTSDKTVVGDLASLVINAPDLFQQYRDACPGFCPDFPTWISRDDLVSRIVEVYRENSGAVDYFAICRYVKMGVEATKMTVQEFASHNHNTVALWMSVNKERAALRASAFSIDEVIANSAIYTEFYLKGWWHHYNGDIDKFLQSKKDGWSHTASGVSSRASDNTALNAKIAAKQAKQEKAAAMFLNMNNLIKADGSLNLEAFGLNKPVANTTKPVAKKVVDSDSDSDSSDSDSDSDSDSSDSDCSSECSDDEFNVSSFKNADFSSGIDDLLNTKPKKVLPLNSMTTIGRMYTHYIFREQMTASRDSGDVVLRKVYFGPFDSQSKAVQVEKALKVFNKTKCGRGMNTKVVKTDGVPAKSADCWNVVYGDTVTHKYEKDTSYDWIVNFLNGACAKDGVFEGCKITSFTTNINSLSDAINEFVERSRAKATLQTPTVAPKAAVPASTPVKKSTRLTQEEIKQRMEDKKKNKQALEDAKEVKKVVSKARPSQREKAVAPEQSETKTAGRHKVTRMHMGSELEVY